MEWSGSQQLFLLLESFGLGVPLGLLFDVMNGIAMPGTRYRAKRFLLDILFGLLAALVTFFGALAIMDGRLHPLLFMGSLVGFVTEHLCIGHCISYGVRRIHRAVARLLKGLCDGAEGLIGRLAGFLSSFFTDHFAKNGKRQKKQRQRTRNREKTQVFSKKP